jgi:hypothetical protein
MEEWPFYFAQRPELSDTMHGEPMQTGQPNGVRSSDWLDDIDRGRMIKPTLYG